MKMQLELKQKSTFGKRRMISAYVIDGSIAANRIETHINKWVCTLHCETKPEENAINSENLNEKIFFWCIGLFV